MKLILCSSIFFILVVSCKKETTRSSTPYIGTWEYRGYEGTPIRVEFDFLVAPGNGTLIKFTTDTIYQYKAGRLIMQFGYHIEKDTCLMCYDSKVLMDRVFYEDEADVTATRWYNFVEIKDDTLLSYSYRLDGAYKNKTKAVKIAD